MIDLRTSSCISVPSKGIHAFKSSWCTLDKQDVLEPLLLDTSHLNFSTPLTLMSADLEFDVPTVGQSETVLIPLPANHLYTSRQRRRRRPCCWCCPVAMLPGARSKKRRKEWREGGWGEWGLETVRFAGPGQRGGHERA